MKKCPNCAQEHRDDAQFCEKCGAFLGTTSLSERFFDFLSKFDFLSNTGKTAQKFSPANASPLCTYPQKKDSKAFISQDETVQATIGVSYLSGEGYKRGSAILTDKRLYYFGKMFTGKCLRENVYGKMFTGKCLREKE